MQRAVGGATATKVIPGWSNSAGGPSGRGLLRQLGTSGHPRPPQTGGRDLPVSPGRAHGYGPDSSGVGDGGTVDADRVGHWRSVSPWPGCPRRGARWRLAERTPAIVCCISPVPPRRVISSGLPGSSRSGTLAVPEFPKEAVSKAVDSSCSCILQELSTEFHLLPFTPLIVVPF